MSAWYWVFWIAAAYVFYTYIGYPALLTLWRLVQGPRKGAWQENYLPFVSVIVTVRDEDEHIARKLQDLVEQDYPRDRIEIWVASDQSTDWTNDLAEGFRLTCPNFHLAAYEENVGKSVAINRTVPRVRGEIIVLSDARQRVEPDAVRKLVRHFADPKVGVVGAEMTLVDAAGKPSAECTGLYWRYERGLRRLESSLGLLAGVSGAFFALRKEVFRDIPPGSYCEDVTLALYARQQGYSVRWEPHARVYERMRDPYTEFRRKVRTLVGNYQLLSQFWPLYLPWRGKLAFTLISHKLCRLFIPLALAALFAASAALAASHPVYLAALIAQALLYGAGIAGLARAAWRRSRLVNACGAFCMLNWAALVALFHVLRHGPRIQWR
jgi:cellulose synthase/poly-beta-1,6-N-acetylglucosamine synthase-like glycosyltransferase